MLDDVFNSQLLVDGNTSNEPAYTVADAAEPVTTTGQSTDMVSDVVDTDDAPDSESSDDLEDENTELYCMMMIGSTNFWQCGA